MPLMNGSAPMKPVRGCASRLRDQMLGAAEADLEPDVVDRRPETAPRDRRRRRAEIEREARQQRLEQRRLPRAQRMSLAPAEEGALGFGVVVVGSSRFVKHNDEQMAGQARPFAPIEVIGFDQNAFLSCAARSVRSQEKPPSFSGARPKWP